MWHALLCRPDHGLILLYYRYDFLINGYIIGPLSQFFILKKLTVHQWSNEFIFHLSFTLFFLFLFLSFLLLRLRTSSRKLSLLNPFSLKIRKMPFLLAFVSIVISQLSHMVLSQIKVQPNYVLFAGTI